MEQGLRRCGVSLLALLIHSAFTPGTLRGQTLGAAASFTEAETSSSLPSGVESPASDAEAADGFVPRHATGRILLHGLGFSVHAGANGLGGDIALPVAKRYNVRVGGEYFHYTTQFAQEGADVTAALRLGLGRAAVDWFPFNNGFRVSPQVVFGIQTRVNASVVVPSGRTISLDGQDYVSSDADPLRGTALIQTRKVAPGLTVGWGNIAPHGDRHWSFPVDLGFYYIGQPSLDVTFQGSACDPRYPQPLGCQEVTSDPGFQRDLNAFIQRNQNNLSYVSFFPVASFGVGYRF